MNRTIKKIGRILSRLYRAVRIARIVDQFTVSTVCSGLCICCLGCLCCL